ncbi:MAG: hypothetical protein Q9209_007893 [Squamulea sp. 1 TL-2023]
MTVICKGETYRGPFKEGLTKTIDLSEGNSLLIISTMIQYFYSLDYRVEYVPEDTNHLEFHFKMFSIADKYGVLCLKNFAADKFKTLCSVYATKGAWDLKKEFDILMEAMPMVYGMTQEDDALLRSHLVHAIKRKLDMNVMLLEDDRFKDKCLQYPEFTYNVLKSVMHPWPHSSTFEVALAA